jgi:HEAT repeat protein
MRSKLALVVSVVAALGAVAPSGEAVAAKPKKASAEPQMQLPAGTMDKLHSGDDATIKSALDDVRTVGKGAVSAAPAIVELLDHGAAPDLTVQAIDTLGDLEAGAATHVLTWYAVHRNISVRQAAVKALARTKGAEAITALRHALSDGDGMVRGMAATGLGTLKAKDSVRDLFVALDHRVSEASASIGQLCTPAECEELAGKLGKVPFDVVTSGIDQVLFRPPTEIDEDEKVKMVGRLRELGTSEVNRFLRDVQKRWPATWSARVKQAIDQGVLATNGVSP